MNNETTLFFEAIMLATAKRIVTISLTDAKDASNKYQAHVCLMSAEEIKSFDAAIVQEAMKQR
jgi:hypothetical protein